MRKQYKEKKESCGLCKPHKKGWENRWKHNDREELKSFEHLKAKVKQIDPNELMYDTDEI